MNSSSGFSNRIFLGRQQPVVISDYTSIYVNVTSGGSQGSVFAIFLFSVFINELPEVLLNESFFCGRP